MRDDDAANAPTQAPATIGDTVAAPIGSASASAPGTSRHFVPGRELARGGMGRVVIAEDLRLGRTVALKLLTRESPALRARFEREAAITARLAHPAIVPIYEAGQLDNGEPFYAMKLVEGTPLDRAIANATDLPARLALMSSAMAVCEALAYAHSKRIIHRDLKPANVLVGSFGETVVIDWGIAKDLASPVPDLATLPPQASPVDVTIDGEVMGTPSYMPPEQAIGGAVDERADVYALGALLYHVVSGRAPYRGTTAAEILAAIEIRPPPPIREIEPAVPDDLASIIAKAMARDPAARYPTAGELADELRRFIDGRLVASHRYSGAELPRRWLRKHRTPVAVAAVAIAVLAVGAIVSVRKIVAREHETAHALAESRLEQGRQFLIGGEAGRSAPYIAIALAELPDDPIARRLASMAVRDAGRRIATFEGRAAAFRRDGRELAIARADDSIVVVDPVTGKLLRELPAAGHKVAQLDFAPDGALIAVASESGVVLVDAGTGARRASATTLPTAEVRFLPRGDLVAIATATDVSLVGIDGKLVAADHNVAKPHGLVIAADGNTLAALDNATAIAWRVPDLARVAEARAGDATWFSVELDRGDLLTAGNDGLRRWGARPATLVHGQIVALSRLDADTIAADGTIVHTDTGAVHEFAHDPIQAAAVIDRTHVIAGGYDRTLRVWDLERPARPAIAIDAAAATTALVVDPTGQRAVSLGTGLAIELWDLAGGREPLKVAAVGSRIEEILTDHRDRLAVHVNAGATKLMTSALEDVKAVPGWPITFSPTGTELVTDLDGRLAVYSARTGALVRNVADGDKLWRAAYAPGGQRIATSSDTRVTVRDGDWRATSSFVSPGKITALAIDDAGRIATGYNDGAIRIWDGQTGALLHTIAGHTAQVADLELRGATLISYSWDLTTRRWEFPSGASRGTLKTYDRIVDGVTLSPDGQLIATVDGTDTVSVWDTAHGRLLEHVPTADGLASVRFIDNDHVVTGGDGGHLELIDVKVPERSLDDVTRLVQASSRWRIEHGHVVERH